ncbi:hypothetical protein VU11_04490 [Desulfobulbus sp. US2]|nr:hypothetical protein [Desulfobulbus sp. US4]MCW5207916.1 hypothetical protein [Desulfobulbus sp. US2]
MYSTTITKSYISMRSLYLGAKARKDENFSTGRTTVTLSNENDFSVEGSLDSQGYLSGMAKLYKKMALKDGDEISFKFSVDGTIVITEVITVYKTDCEDDQTSELEPEEKETVFKRDRLNHIHIEAFRPENLNIWEPETEADVYLVFGVLQDFTDFQYCCGTSISILKKLGANYEDSAKPDAILIDRISEQYLMAEWKKKSSDYKLNHNPDDVDVLVCWTDNEINRDLLPPRVLALHTVAKAAAETALKDGN